MLFPIVKDPVTSANDFNHDLGMIYQWAYQWKMVAVAQWFRASNIFLDNCVSQHLSGAGSSPAGSVGRDFNLQKLIYQYLTTSVAVVLVVR